MDQKVHDAPTKFRSTWPETGSLRHSHEVKFYFDYTWQHLGNYAPHLIIWAASNNGLPQVGQILWLIIVVQVLSGWRTCLSAFMSSPHTPQANTKSIFILFHSKAKNLCWNLTSRNRRKNILFSKRKNIQTQKHGCNLLVTEVNNNEACTLHPRLCEY